MKHDFKITLVLVAIFLLSQFLGLGLLAHNAETMTVVEPGTNQSTIVVHYNETVAGPRPEVSGYGSVIYIALAVAFGTLLLLFLIKFKLGGKLWKAWYFLAVMIAIAIALGVFVSPLIAYAVAGFLAILKLFYRNVFTHNITEMLMYSGIALLIVPLFTVLWATVLLLLISVYDMYAVWKSKHMVKLAKFTSKENLFPGIAINYTPKDSVRKSGKHFVKKKSVSSSPKKVLKKPGSNKRQAILGGGDVIFPLIFTGTVLNALLSSGFSKLQSFGLSLVVTFSTAVALYLLFAFAKKEKFYPAMPFITAGCFAGFLILTGVLFIF